MATQEALGHHHPIVVVAVEVSSVGGSAGIGQERTMPDGELAAGGREVEGGAGRGIAHAADGAGGRRGDAGGARGLGVCVAGGSRDLREAAEGENGTTSGNGSVGLMEESKIHPGSFKVPRTATSRNVKPAGSAHRAPALQTSYAKDPTPTLLPDSLGALQVCSLLLPKVGEHRETLPFPFPHLCGPEDLI